MSTELAEVNKTNVPDWMRKASTGVKIGNVDSSDLKPPRLKILAGQSPEIMNRVPGAVPGNFWMTIVSKNLGEEVIGTPIILKKSYQLWHPRVAGRANEGPLATASDGISWDVPNQTFKVIFPPNQGGGEEMWKIGKLVTDYRMHKFGSSRPHELKSAPAATLTYDVLWVIDMPDGKKQLCVFSSSKTGVTPTQNWISQAMNMGVDQFFQRYRIVVKMKTNNKTGDPYFTFDYQFAGLIDDEKTAMDMKALYDQYSRSGFVTDFEAEAGNIDDDKRGPVFDRGVAGEAEDDSIPF